MASDLKLVQNQSKESVEAKHAVAVFQGSIQELTANLLRIAAGAGSAHRIAWQIHDACKAYIALHPHCGTSHYPHPPGAAIEEALRDRDWRMQDERYESYREMKLHPGPEAKLDCEKDRVVKAALQLVAAQLMAQPTQESKARDDLEFGIRRAFEAWKDWLEGIRGGTFRDYIKPDGAETWQ